MDQPIFSYTARAFALREYYGGSGYYFVFHDGKGEHTLPLYPVNPPKAEATPPYLGLPIADVLASGRDLLGEALLQEGEPDYRAVKGALPPLSCGIYTILGGVSSVSGLTVDALGVVHHQHSGREREPAPIFTPSECDARLGAIPPRQMLLAGAMPLLLSVHSDGQEMMELLYFVEPTDPDRDPICWIREKRYRADAPQKATLRYRVAAIAREATEQEMKDSAPSEEIFLDALGEAIAFWLAFYEGGARFTIPEEELARIARGTAAVAALTMTGDHTHYGHGMYGKELHDNFPPNYIYTIDAAVRLGRHAEARDIFRHFLRFVLRTDGRVNYRQGASLLFGASAAEYGMLLDLAAKYRDILGTDALSPQELHKLRGMGDEILSHLGDFEGHRLIVMCAEADTNERVHAYMNNNLWAIRGLRALGSLLSKGGEEYRTAADLLADSVNAAIAQYSADGRFGRLPPFRLGYTATPRTLSRCYDTFYPTDKETLEGYFRSIWERHDLGGEEDYVENSFANYRHYPEMLSSMLLPQDCADAILRMREALGGEILGMTRFLNRIDDWPVLNYARFLLESGRIEKYLLLLYAHAAHHGDPVRMTYYEQVNHEGRVLANDCLPSMLTVPTMLAMMFAYESVAGDALYLLPALPKAWYSLPFSACGIGYSGGLIDLTSDGKTIRVRLSRVATLPISLCIRDRAVLTAEDILAGQEYIDSLQGNRIYLKAGIRDASITLRTK